MKNFIDNLRVVFETFVRFIIFFLACIEESLEAVAYSLCLVYWMFTKQDLMDKNEWWNYNITYKIERFFFDVLRKLDL